MPSHLEPHVLLRARQMFVLGHNDKGEALGCGRQTGVHMVSGYKFFLCYPCSRMREWPLGQQKLHSVFRLTVQMPQLKAVVYIAFEGLNAGWQRWCTQTKSTREERLNSIYQIFERELTEAVRVVLAV